MHIHSHDCASRWIFFTKVITAAHMAITPIPTASTITIIHWPSIVHVTWAWLALALKARSPRTTLRTFRTTRSIRLVNRWAKRYKHRNILRGRGLLFFRLVTLRGELFLLFLRRVQGLRFFRNFISRYRRLLVSGLGFSAGGGLGFGGGGGGTISMLLMESPPLQRIFSLIFSGEQHTTLITTVFCFSSYTWSRISCSQNSTPPHIYIESTQSFSFSPCCFISNHVKYITTTERVQRERETHEGIYIEFSSPSCSSDGTEDQPSAPLSLSPVKKE
jgi:hypothetical protein